MPFPFLGGVNLLNDSRAIRDDQLIRAKNLITVQPGVLGKRPAMKWALNTYQFAGVPGPIWKYLQVPFGNSLMFAAFVHGDVIGGGSKDGYLIASGADNIGSVTSQVVGSGSMNRAPAMVAFNGKIYAFASYPDLFSKIIQLASGGFEIANFSFSGTNNESLMPGVAAVYKNRMLFANFGPGFESYLVFSDRYEPQTIGDDVLAANGRNVIVGARDGDRIIAIHEVTTTAAGSPAQSVALVLKEFSSYILAGEPNETDDLDDYLGTLEVNKFTVACGCVSASTITDTPFGTIWCGPDDVWLMPPGGVPYQVGTNIRALIKGQPRNLKYKLFGAYFDGFYRLSLFAPGQGATDSNAPAEQWWLDLRDGAPRNYTEARWWGPQVYVPSTYGVVGNGTSANNTNPTEANWGLVLENRPSMDNQLYSIAFGRTHITLNSINTEDGYDNATEVSNVGPAWSALTAYSVGDIIYKRLVTGAAGYIGKYTVITAGTSGASEPSWTNGNTTDGTITWSYTSGSYTPASEVDTEVLTELVTKEFDAPDSMLDKLFNGIELDIYTQNSTRLQVDMIVTGGKTTTSVTKDLDVLGQSFQVGWTSFNNVLTRQFVTVPVRPADGARVIGTTYQLRIQDLAGYVVNSDNNQIAFTHSIDGELVGTIATGLYANLKTLLDAVVAAMNAVSNRGYFHNRSTIPPLANQTLVEISAGAASGTFTWNVNVSSESNRLIALLGYSFAYPPPATAIIQRADTEVHNSTTCVIQLGNILLDVEVFKRRP